MRADVVERNVMHLEAQSADHLHGNLRVGHLPRDEFNRVLRGIDAGLFEKRLGFLKIGLFELIGLIERAVKIEVVRPHELVARLRTAAAHKVHEPRLINAVGQSLPHADVVKGFARLAVIEGEEVPGTVFEAFNDRGARALQIFGGIFADIGNIQVARADGKALVCAVAKVKMHGGEFGEPLLPVVSKSRSVQTDLREPFAEAEGARADRLRNRGVPARGFRRKNPELCHERHEGSEGAGEGNHHRAGFGHREALNVFKR